MFGVRETLCIILRIIVAAKLYSLTSAAYYHTRRRIRHIYGLVTIYISQRYILQLFSKTLSTHNFHNINDSLLYWVFFGNVRLFIPMYIFHIQLYKKLVTMFLLYASILMLDYPFKIFQINSKTS